MIRPGSFSYGSCRERAMPVWRNPRPFSTIESSTDLARLLGISWDDIDRLANPDHDHYRRWFVKKRSGAKRPISSPEADLAEAQRRIARRMRRAPLHRAALGYRLKASIRTHASRHLDRAFVIHFDLEDFFHSIGDDRVKSLLRSLGASAGASAVMSRLLTEPISPGGRASRGRRSPAATQGAARRAQLADSVEPDLSPA